MKKRFTALTWLFLFIPMEARLSGQQQVGLDSANYNLQLHGGLSSWNYDAVRSSDERLRQALQALKPALDDAFNTAVSERSLADLIGSYTLSATRLNGVEIMSAPEKEACGAHNFSQYKNTSAKGQLNASRDKRIGKTSFTIYLTIVVNDRCRA